MLGHDFVSRMIWSAKCISPEPFSNSNSISVLEIVGGFVVPDTAVLVDDQDAEEQAKFAVTVLLNFSTSERAGSSDESDECGSRGETRPVCAMPRSRANLVCTVTPTSGAVQSLRWRNGNA